MQLPSLQTAIFGGAGVVLLAAAALVLWFEVRVLDWPVVQASVVSSRVTGQGNDMYSAERVFRYSVAGREYTVTDSSSMSSM